MIPYYLQKQLEAGLPRETVRLIPRRSPDLFIPASKEWTSLQYWEKEGIIAFEGEDFGSTHIVNSYLSKLQTHSEYMLYLANSPDHPRFQRVREYFDQKMNTILENELSL